MKNKSTGKKVQHARNVVLLIIGIAGTSAAVIASGAYFDLSSGTIFFLHMVAFLAAYTALFRDHINLPAVGAFGFSLGFLLLSIGLSSWLGNTASVATVSLFISAALLALHLSLLHLRQKLQGVQVRSD